VNVASDYDTYILQGVIVVDNKTRYGTGQNAVKEFRFHSVNHVV